MKTTNTKRVIAIILVLVTLGTLFSTFAHAASTVNAFDVPTSSKYAKVYTLSSSGTTIPYTSKTLSTRGTTTRASSTAYIDNASDELYLFDVGKTNGKAWAYVSYPTSSGRVKAYIPLSAISNASYGSNHLYYASSCGKFYCSPRKEGSTSSSYWVDKGDTVYVFAAHSKSGNNVQIMYPVGNGSTWRIAWCAFNDAVNYLDGANETTTSTSSKIYTGYVNTASAPLVLRKSASTSAKALTNMPRGASLTVLDNKAKTNGFYHVIYQGQTGYASASYITFSKAIVKKGSVQLNVPLYKQGDGRWSGTYIGNKTIGRVGCTTTCLAMIYSYKNGTTCYPNQMKNKLSYSNNDLYWSSLSNVGISYSKEYNCSLNQSIMSTIYSKLKSGCPVMIGCNGGSSRGQHWVVVTGYTGSTSNFSASNFTINDPGSANDTTLAGFVSGRGTIVRIAW